MKKMLLVAAAGAAALLIAGCETPLPPGTERGPQGTIAYNVAVNASPPGARIEANGTFVGNTPLTLKIFGDRDGTFHDFGSYFYVVRAFPLVTNQFPQTLMFGTGRNGAREDKVPQKIYFNMNQPSAAYGPMEGGPPDSNFVPPGYPWGYYYPYYWGPYWGWGPGVRVFVGPGFYHGHFRH